MPQIINGTWADITPGQWLLNERTMTLHEVLQVREGWVQVDRPRVGDEPGWAEPKPLRPQAPDFPVILVVPNAAEADRLVTGELGGQVVKG